MNKITNLWNWLNGKKTVIGAILHFAVFVVTGLGTYFGFHPLSAAVLGQIDTVANGIITVGLGHKVLKNT